MDMRSPSPACRIGTLTLPGRAVKSTREREPVHTRLPVVRASAPLVGTSRRRLAEHGTCVPMEYRSHGFTLIELLVTLGIAALILGLAAPSFSDFRANGRLTSTANDFLGAVQYARTEAIKRQQSVSVCATADPTSPAATCALGPFRSWLVFVDLNNNCLRAGAGEDILRADGPIDASVSTRSNGLCVSFAPTGFVQPLASTGQTSATRTLYCDTRGLLQIGTTNQSAGRGIFVTNTGRSRVSREITSGTSTDIDNWGIACP